MLCENKCLPVFLHQVMLFPRFCILWVGCPIVETLRQSKVLNTFQLSPLPTVIPWSRAELDLKLFKIVSDIKLLWCRPAGTAHYRPRPSRSVASVIISCLLLTSGNGERNPEPTINVSNISLGCVNVHSAIHKAALIHDIINDHHLDVLALQETWISADSPPAVQADVAPCGYSVLHAHRPLVHEGPTRGGGLAVIHSDAVTMRSITLPILTPPLSFETRVVALGPASHQTVLINIYRPPSSSVPVFLDELAYLITAFSVRVPRKLVLCGNLNCPRIDCSHVDNDLALLLDTFGLCQHVCEPTRGANLLDILASEDVSSVSNLVVDDAGLISDHRLIIARVRRCLPARRATPFTFRDIKNVNHQQSEQALYSSELFTAPTSTVDAFTKQLVSVVRKELDLVAPVQSTDA